MITEAPISAGVRRISKHICEGVVLPISEMKLFRTWWPKSTSHTFGSDGVRLHQIYIDLSSSTCGY